MIEKEKKEGKKKFERRKKKKIMIQHIWEVKTSVKQDAIKEFSDNVRDRRERERKEERKR